MPIIANAGVPMLEVYWPPAWLALAPIIAVEAWMATRMLRVSWRPAAGACLMGNLVSTAVGIPVTWAVLALIELRWFAGEDVGGPLTPLVAVTLQAPWLLPYEPMMVWLITGAALVLSIPFWLTSFAVEHLVARLVLRDVSARALRRWALRSNAVTYAGLYALILLLTWWPRIQHDLGPFMDEITETVFELARM